MSSTPETFTFPLCSMGVASDSHPRTGIATGVPRGDKLFTVLLVDDEPNVLEVRRLLLERLGYAALVADSGQKALEVFGKNIVDVVILDYVMPGMDGGETAREIRKLDRAIPIILSTASVGLPDAVLRLFSACVPKGSGPRCLLEALAEQVQHLCRPTDPSTQATRRELKSA